MKLIKKPVKVFSAAVGKQKFDIDKIYVESPYIIKTAVQKGCCMYNTMTGMMVLLEEDEYNHYKASDYSFDFSEQLIENWFLVDREVDLFNFYKHYKSTVDFLLYNGCINQYTILPTTDCNARCFYCYEKNIKKESMSKEISDDASDFIIRTADKNGIELRWFGGEPLYNSGAIDNICNILKNKEIKYKSSIITNGILFSDECIKTAKELWNLKKVQITLDGTEKEYNNTKNYIYDDITNPFEIVLSNIASLLESNIRVIVRLNISKTNIDDLFDLVTILNKRYNDKHNLSVYTSVLYQLRNTVYVERGTDSGLLDQIQKLNDYIYNSGLNNTLINNKSYTLNNCMADNKGAILISPDGKLHKCDHYCKNDEVGDIYSGINKLDTVEKLREESYLNECRSCAFLPICNHLPYCEGYVNNCNSSYREQLRSDYNHYIKNTLNRILNIDK